MDQNTLSQQIEASQKRIEADFILKNAVVADVFSLRWRKASIVVKNGKIIAVDENDDFFAKVEEDAEGKYVIPGLIDAHIHIESSMLPPSQFNQVILPHGITSVITDPHEIVNVSGSKGMKFMLEDARNAGIDIYFMLPSSVPSTSFEHAGAVMKAKDLAPFLINKEVLGLAEVMDFPAVLNSDSDMLDKLMMAVDSGCIIDGHGAGLNSSQIRGYRAAGIHTDHECVSAEEARERVQQGMYVLLREGSAAKNVVDLLPAINTVNARRFTFCTDDKHLDELIEEGSINYAVALAIKHGMEPLQAIQLATLNAAECYRLFGKGAITEGYIADFVLLEDLETMKAKAVWKDGVKVAENGQVLRTELAPIKIDDAILNSVHIPSFNEQDLAIPFLKGNKANVIEIIPNQITTKRVVMEVEVENGYFKPSIERDLLKLAVIERHHKLGTKGLAIVHGFKLKKGAVATTIAHDSHNAIVVGTNDQDMVVALEELQKIKGGLVVANEGKIIGSLPLEIAGLMSTLPAYEALTKLQEVHDALHQIHPELNFHFFLTLSFLSLPVIPELKLTDTGLFDVSKFEHISIEVD
ncbi:adenine deaminase [Lysinibacillus composti]|uniref:Adenine deaminase n=1 Tax=Lysinibacillus composti TaxID=720633 RepID=A0A3N9U2X0_9BACI|nr:adenine deaminase [Lysinibacillus composti]MBM7610727.1 adenine deaminase [Lysinibacillus composti]RQW70935.1 adenine deaminase [Lysinibacillus composti]